MRIALIGATGLIGRNLWPLLAAEDDLLTISRRPSGAPHELIGPMETWPVLLEGRQIDVAISTLGTTRKKAGSWEAFTAVDYHAVLAFAHAAKHAGARQMIMISSVGADAGSKNMYLALKGRVERDVAAVGFERLDLFRPGLLVGDRGAERRTLERLGMLISPLANLLFRGRLDRYAAIEAELVAQAIATVSGAPGSGKHVHFNRAIKRLAST